MTVKWLVENFEADNKIWKLIAELKNRNQPLEVIDYYNYYLRGNIQNDDGTVSASSFNDDDCVMFMGSIQLALHIKRHKPWVPGIWLDPEKFKCTTYYSYLGEHLFNFDYAFTTVGEFKRRHEFFYGAYGVDNCLFIRPDTGLKSFTGQLFYKERHETDWKFFDQTTKPEDIIVIAQPAVIDAEYRVVIAKGEPITASMYQYEGERKQLPGAPKNVFEKAKEIATIIDRDLKVGPMYVVDIAVTPLKCSLMEINCFNCAGLYETDKKIVVDAANQIALEEYQQYKKDEAPN
jgi:hypothetical protein